MVIKMLTRLERKVDELQEIENIKKEPKLKNTGNQQYIRGGRKTDQLLGRQANGKHLS